MTWRGHSAILIAGCTSDAGKSVVVAGLCRMLARRGVRVAPFKAQNMSNNSVVTLDGGEIGRAQALQAAACGLAPRVRFNPILLKPGSDRRSQLIVRGKPAGTVSAADYMAHREHLRELAAAELASLRAEYDIVICEGAGSPAEINLRATDVANFGLARAADLPVAIVGDIDRGGVLAHFYGTVKIVDPADAALVTGFIVNKFRGDVGLLEPGLAQLRDLTGLPTFGVLPYSPDIWIDAEDSLSVVRDASVGRPAPPIGQRWLSVAAIRLPRVSNSTDIEALACEPGVSVRWVSDPSRVLDADLVVVPGSKSTVSDLDWLREQGFAAVLAERAVFGRPVLGICGGYQMLGKRIIDTVESGAGEVPGLGLFDIDVEFATEKTVAQRTGKQGEIPLAGYEIHHGQVVRNTERPWFTGQSGEPEGSLRGAVYGTHWHGVLESDDFRREFLREVVAQTRQGFTVAPDTDCAAVRLAQLDLLADLVEANLDTAALLAEVG